MTDKLSHINDKGEANMVDVSAKEITKRVATARGFISMSAQTLDMIAKGEAKKGDVLATARIAGIMAAKRTHDLIPLCHPLAIQNVTIDLTPSQTPVGIAVEASVKVTGKTGVEMEALTAVSIACLTLYDMVKAVDRAMVISDVRLVEKSGGRSGHFKAD